MISKKGRFLIWHTLKTKFFNKVFLIVNIGLLLLVLGVTNIGNIINAVAKDKDTDFTVYIVNNTNNYENMKENTQAIYDALKEQNSNLKGTKYKIEYLSENNNDLTQDDYESFLYKKTDIIMVFDIVKIEANGTTPENENIVLTYYRYDKPDIALEIFISTVYNAFYSVEHDFPTDAPAPVVKDITYSDKLSEQNAIIVRSIAPMFGIPIFIFIMMAIQFTGSEIVEEKSSKMIEIVLSNVKASEHLLSKIIAVTIGLTTQLILMFIYSLIGMFVAGLIGSAMSGAGLGGFDIKEIFSSLPGFLGAAYDRLIPSILFLILFLALGFLSFTILSGIFAASSASVQDFNKVSTPLIFFLMSGYMVNIMSASLGDRASVAMMFSSFIPLVSFQTAPIAYFLGDISLLGMGISILINLVFITIILKLSFKTYKVAILNFSDAGAFKLLISSIRKRKEQ